jgi:hypothetical protein
MIKETITLNGEDIEIVKKVLNSNGEVKEISYYKDPDTLSMIYLTSGNIAGPINRLYEEGLEELLKIDGLVRDGNKTKTELGDQLRFKDKDFFQDTAYICITLGDMIKMEIDSEISEYLPENQLFGFATLILFKVIKYVENPKNYNK